MYNEILNNLWLASPEQNVPLVNITKYVWIHIDFQYVYDYFKSTTELTHSFTSDITERLLFSSTALLQMFRRTPTIHCPTVDTHTFWQNNAMLCILNLTYHT